MTIHSLIAQHGGKLVRSKRHDCYRFPDGRLFTMPQSPSDTNFEKIKLAELKRFLGMIKTTATVGERRPKRTKRKAKRPVIKVTVEPAPPRKTMADGLKELYVTMG